MWWCDRTALPRLIRLAVALAIAGTAGACFQPLYGERTLVSGSPPLRDAMAAVEVAQIEAPLGTPLARIAVETRNALLFDLTGGSGPPPQTHKLVVRLQPTTAILIVDPTSQRNEYENFGLNASYTLVEIPTGKPVVNGFATTRVTYTVPGLQQRFTKLRAARDAESRAAKLIADQIKTRLASYFVAGT
jgi:LPS-assembly lipoprotein